MPIINLDHKSFAKNNGTFLVDTGCQLNLIKEKTLNSFTKIDTSITFDLVGIGKGSLRTYGETVISVNDVDIEFQIVDDNFPIDQDGIIGIALLKKQEAILKFRQKLPGSLFIGNNEIPFVEHATFELQPRSRHLVKIPIKNTKLKTGYLKRVSLGEDVYLGEALVSNDNGYAQAFCINTTTKTIKVSIPAVEIEPYETLEPLPRTARKADTASDPEKVAALRLKKISELLPLDGLNAEETASVLKLVNEFPFQFHLPGDKIKGTKLTKHTIKTTDETPVYTKQFRFTPALNKEIESQVNTLLDNDIIEESYSPWNSPVFIIPKKDSSPQNRKYRMVIDYRKVNAKTVKDKYPLPDISEILAQLGNSKYFSILDLNSGFHQIPLDEASKEKTAFSTNTGHYHFKRLSFGLANGPPTFQRLMNQLLSGLQNIELFIYMDDVVIFSASLEEQIERLKNFLGRIKTAGLTLSPEKCYFLRREVIYLGHHISSEGVKPDAKKIEAVKSFKVPKTKKQCKQFLGLVGYYRKFVKDFAKIARPINLLLKKRVEFKWDEAAQKSFETLRDLICTAPILIFPDFNKPFYVTCDASQYAIGSILSQGPSIGEDRPIAFASRSLNEHEIRYSVIEKELLSIIHAVQHFRPYLYGHPFTLITDHRALIYINKTDDPTSRLMRWRIKLNEYDYTIVYKKGCVNTNADALSRNPVYLCTCKEEVKRTSSQVNSISITSDSDSRSVQKMPDWPDRLSVADFEMSTESFYDRFFDYENENKLSSVFFACEKTVEKNTDYFENNKIIEMDIDDDKDSSCDMTYETETTCSNEAGNGNSYGGHRVSPNFDWVPVIPGGCVSPDKNGLIRRSTEKVGARIPEVRINHSRIEPTRTDNIDVDTIPKITYNKDKLFMRNDNLINFTAIDCKIESEVTKELFEHNKFKKENMKVDDSRIGDAIGAKYNKSKYTFHLIIKNSFDDTPDLIAIKAAMQSLKLAMDNLELKSFSMSKYNNEIDCFNWNYIEQLLKEIFNKNTYKITICTGEIMIPVEFERESIIKEYHESLVGGHQGVSSLYSRIRENFYWPDLHKQVENFVLSCNSCQKNKNSNQRVRMPMHLTDTPKKAFDKIQMDILGPLPISETNNRYLLTIQCVLTKYSDAIPIPNMTAQTIACTFAEHFITRHGCPKVLQTDQAQNFMAQIMKLVCKIFKIQPITSAAYHHESLGSLERAHRVFIEYLRHYCQFRDWDKWIRYAIFSYNTSKRRSTGFSPHELVYGYPARIPSAFAQEKVPCTFDEYVNDLLTKLVTTQATASANLQQFKLSTKNYYDMDINPKDFIIGEFVYVYNEEAKKLEERWNGPYEIIDVFENYNVEILIDHKKKITKIVHMNRLKLACIRP